MSYDYDKFVHPVPAGHVIQKGTQVRSVVTSGSEESFYTTQYSFRVPGSDTVMYYLDYDITMAELPTKINSVIYDVSAVGNEFPVVVYQGSNIWTAFTKQGERSTLYTPEIESFDTAPGRKKLRVISTPPRKDH